MFHCRDSLKMSWICEVKALAINSVSKFKTYFPLNPLTAGAVHIRVLHFILGHYISAFEPVTIISKIWNLLTSILSNLNNFHSLEVVDRVSETQLKRVKIQII